MDRVQQKACQLFLAPLIGLDSGISSKEQMENLKIIECALGTLKFIWLVFLFSNTVCELLQKLLCCEPHQVRNGRPLVRLNIAAEEECARG